MLWPVVESAGKKPRLIWLNFIRLSSNISLKGQLSFFSSVCRPSAEILSCLT